MFSIMNDARRFIYGAIMWAAIIYGVVLGCQSAYRVFNPEPWYAVLMFWK